MKKYILLCVFSLCFCLLLWKGVRDFYASNDSMVFLAVAKDYLAQAKLSEAHIFALKSYNCSNSLWFFRGENRDRAYTAAKQTALLSVTSSELQQRSFWQSEFANKMESLSSSVQVRSLAVTPEQFLKTPN